MLKMWFRYRRVKAICVRDSDPLGTRPAQRGLVLGGERQALAQTIAPRKDQGLIAMSYKNVYVGRIALGANDAQALKVLQEAEAHNGPSLIICYGPCINHGFDLNSQLEHQKMAVDSGYLALLRYNPVLAAVGKAPLILDSKKPTIPVAEYIYTENRYKLLTRNNPEVARKLADDLQKEVDARYAFYDAMSKDTEGLISL